MLDLATKMDRILRLEKYNIILGHIIRQTSTIACLSNILNPKSNMYGTVHCGTISIGD